MQDFVELRKKLMLHGAVALNQFSRVLFFQDFPVDLADDVAIHLNDGLKYVFGCSVQGGRRGMKRRHQTD